MFLDLFGFQRKSGQKGFGMHPHSGMATLTFMIEGDVAYKDTTGKTGVLRAGGVEWMRAGNGVWHDGGPASDSPIRGFQPRVALPAAEENAPAPSIYLAPSQVPQERPVHVLLGRHGAARRAVSSRHPHNLVPGYYSVHRSQAALARGEAEIQRGWGRDGPPRKHAY